MKINIGEHIKNDKIDFKIIDSEIRISKNNRRNRYYKYHCNKCDNEDWMRIDHIKKSVGCNVCGKHTIGNKLGLNTLYDVYPWVVDLGVSEEDAKKYNPRSRYAIEVTCPYCGCKKDMKISNIISYESIGCNCGDGKSYPEKFMFSLLKQLDVEFETEVTIGSIGKSRYDFYLKDYNTIIETHGEYHYSSKSIGRTLENTKNIDKEKRELAIKNGIENYIEIDCRKSKKDYIKKNILNSELNNIVDLSKIDFEECHKFGKCNLINEIYEEFKSVNNKEWIIEKYKINKETLNRYIRIGNTYINNIKNK